MPASLIRRERDEVTPPAVRFTGSTGDVTGAIQRVFQPRVRPSAFPQEEYIKWGMQVASETIFPATLVSSPRDARDLLMIPRFIRKAQEVFRTDSQPSVRVVDEVGNEGGVFVVVETPLPPADAVSALVTLKDWLRSDSELNSAAHVPIAIDSV